MPEDAQASPQAAARKYGERLGALTDIQFQATLDRFGLGEFVRAEPAACGLFGQNAFVTSTRGEFVLRGCGHGDWQFPKERYFANFIHERTDVPAPWPYLVDDGKDIFGWSYVLMPRMPGFLPVDAWFDALTPSDRAGIAHAMGECLVRLHRPEGPCPGEYDLESGGIRPFEKSWEALCVDEVRDALLEAQGNSKLTTNDDMAWVEQLVEQSRPALREPFKPGYVFHDYKRGNVTVRREGSGWQVSGVFDLTEGFFGDSESDLWRFLSDADEPQADAFLKGYRSRGSFRPGFAERAKFYLLQDRLCIWVYGTRPGVGWFKTGTLRQWLEPKLTKAHRAAQFVKVGSFAG